MGVAIVMKARGNRLPARRTFICCGVPVDGIGMERAISAVRDLAISGDGHDVHLCNAYTVSLASRDQSYARLLEASSLNLADGAPVAWTGRRAGFDDLTASVRGPSLMRRVMQDGTQWKARHFLIGGSTDTAFRLREELPRLIPGLNVVGVISPPFRPLTKDEADHIEQELHRTRPDFVWVGLGTPMQDHFASVWAGRVPSVFMAVGAAFDFLSSTKAEAPPWLHNTGLEWIFRFTSEPRRLWKRYLFGNSIFMWETLKRWRTR